MVAQTVKDSDKKTPPPLPPLPTVGQAPPLPPIPKLQPLYLIAPNTLERKEMSWYKGRDLHAYTADLRTRLSDYEKEFQQVTVPQEQFTELLQSIEQRYGVEVRVTLNNIAQYYRNGAIFNPELPNFNFAALLQSLWYELHRIKEESLFLHFKETLLDIGNTCLAGITDRLFADWIAVHPTN